TDRAHRQQGLVGFAEFGSVPAELVLSPELFYPEQFYCFPGVLHYNSTEPLLLQVQFLRVLPISFFSFLFSQILISNMIGFRVVTERKVNFFSKVMNNDEW